MMRNLTYDQLKAIVRKLGFVWFGDRAYDLNIIAIRDKNLKAGEFDDVVYFAYRDTLKLGRVFEMPITTDPLLRYLKEPMNPKGTAILKEGQWRGMLIRGLHKGRPALIQNKPVTVYRDANRDGILDMSNAKLDTGMFGINFHYGTGQSASAGCQVTPHQADLDYCLALNQLQRNSVGTYSVTYTLLLEQWLS